MRNLVLCLFLMACTTPSTSPPPPDAPGRIPTAWHQASEKDAVLVGRLQNFLGANATSDPEFCSDNGETCCTYRDGRYCCCTFLYGGLCTCGTTTP